MVNRVEPKERSKNNLLKRKLYSIVAVTGFLFAFLATSIYFFAFKDTGTSYSFTQKYSEYYGLEDWNLSKHAYLDLDGDGKRDMITFTNCVFLSSVSGDQIPQEHRCSEPTMSSIGFPNDTNIVGQKLESIPSSGYHPLTRSFLVRTIGGQWKYYEQKGFGVATFVMGEDNIFIEANPTFFDKFDALTYQVTHIGVMILLIFMQQFVP